MLPVLVLTMLPLHLYASHCCLALFPSVDMDCDGNQNKPSELFRVQKYIALKGVQRLQLKHEFVHLKANNSC